MTNEYERLVQQRQAALQEGAPVVDTPTPPDLPVTGREIYNSPEFRALALAYLGFDPAARKARHFELILPSLGGGEDEMAIFNHVEAAYAGAARIRVQEDVPPAPPPETQIEPGRSTREAEVANFYRGPGSGYSPRQG